MPPLTIRIMIHVTAGVKRGLPLPDLTRMFIITQEDWNANSIGKIKLTYAKALAYQESLWNVHEVRWVTSEWRYY